MFDQQILLCFCWCSRKFIIKSWMNESNDSPVVKNILDFFMESLNFTFSSLRPRRKCLIYIYYYYLFLYSYFTTLVSVYFQSLCFLLQCRGAHQTVTYRGTLIRLVQYPNVLREVGTTIFWFHSLQSPTTFWKCRLNKMLKSHKGDQFYFLQLWTGETWRREKQPRFCSDTDTEKQTQ